MKKLFTILFLAPLFVLAQSTKYITHTVAAKESLSSIGRLYNINARELAKYNNIDYEKGLSLGQVLKIPATAAAKAVAKTPAPVAEVKVPAKTTVVNNQQGAPIYHTVAKKETLYHISTLYNKVPIADLKKWNNLTGDGLSEGTNLIVGYSNTPANNAASTPVAKPVVATKEEPVKEVVKAKEPVKEVVKVKEPVKQAPVIIEQPKTEEPKQVTSVNITGKKFDGGFFKSSYSKNGKSEESGTAGIFKSTSGWEDGKYYCLHNSAQAGSIVKITNNATKKSIYAKVLDVIPDLKQNKDIVLSVSNAAAEELGVTAANFECTVDF